MPTKEMLHRDVYKHLFTAAVATNTSTAALDLALPLLMQSGNVFAGSSIGNTGNQYAEAAALIADVSGPTSLTAAITLTLTPQEADASGGPWNAIDPMYIEWFQDGVPGGPSGSAGTAVWNPQIPGNVPQTYPAALVLNGAPLESHVYACSYVGGQHRFIRLNLAIAGAVLNVVSVMGALSVLSETYGRLFTNWQYP